MKALDEDDKANIHQTIDDEVLKRRDIAFRSTAVRAAGRGRGRADARRRDAAARVRRSRSADDGTVSGDARPSSSPTGA